MTSCDHGGGSTWTGVSLRDALIAGASSAHSRRSSICSWSRAACRATGVREDCGLLQLFQTAVVAALAQGDEAGKIETSIQSALEYRAAARRTYRNAVPEALVVSDGPGCRHIIHH